MNWFRDPSNLIIVGLLMISSTAFSGAAYFKFAGDRERELYRRIASEEKAMDPADGPPAEKSTAVLVNPQKLAEPNETKTETVIKTESKAVLAPPEQTAKKEDPVPAALVKTASASPSPAESVIASVTTIQTTETSVKTAPAKMVPVASVPAALVAPTPPVPLATPANAVESESLAPQKIGLILFAGVGINYVSYDEKLTDLETNYHDLRGPSTYIGTQLQATDWTGIQASYKVTPIQFDNSSVGLSGQQSSWQILALNAETRSDSFSQKSSRKGIEYDSALYYLYGFQYHRLPLALFKNSTNVPVLKDIGLLNVSLGANYMKYLNAWTRANIMGRWQYPLSSSAMGTGASLSISPVLIFDGSVGIEKKFYPSTWFGLHWYGQYQRLNFDYADSDTRAAGTHTTIFSNMEMRLTFDF